MTTNDGRMGDMSGDEQYREVLGYYTRGRDEGYPLDPDLITGEGGDEYRAAFDRFLARVRRDAWAEGCRAAEQYYRRTVVGIPGLDPIPAPVNPHEETP